MTLIENPETRPAPPSAPVPVERYTSSAFAAREHESLWTNAWQLAGLDSELPNSGDFLEYSVGSLSIIVMRSDDGALRAYHNVCRHRGRRLVAGSGHADELRCPYHGWAWDRQGQLTDVPERETFCEFADSDCALRTVAVDVWNDWIFVNPDRDAEPLLAFLGEIDIELAPFRYDRQYRWKSQRTTVAANWKATVDAFLEAYHARTIHEESNAFINYVGYSVDLFEKHSRMVIPFGSPDQLATDGRRPDWNDTLDAMEWSFAAFDEDTTMVEVLKSMGPPGPDQELRDIMRPMVREGMKTAGIDITALDDSQVVDDWHYFIFPNIVINCYAFGYWLFRIVPDPGGSPDRSVIDMWYFHRVPDAMEIPPPVPTEDIPEGMPCGDVMDQDLRNLPLHQAGLNSPAFTGMRLSSLEARIAHMHDVLDTYLDKAPA